MVFLLLLGAFATWEAARMPFGTAAMPGPGMMPMALGVLLMLSPPVSSCWNCRPRRRARSCASATRHVALAVVAIVVAGLLFERAGFLITSSLFLFVMLVALSRSAGGGRCSPRWPRASPPATSSRTCSASTLPPLPFVT